MPLNRRAFLTTAIAACAIPAMAAPVVPETVGLKVIKTKPVATWGFSTNGGEWWSNGFATKAEVEREVASSLGVGQRFLIGLTTPRSMDIPDDLGERICNAIEYGEYDFGEQLVIALQEENEYNDYEGDFNCACERAPIESLRAKTLDVVCKTLLRHEQAEWVSLLVDGHNLPENIDESHPTLVALREDQTFN